MLLCTEYCKKKCRTSCLYTKGRGIFTYKGEKISNIDDVWLEYMKEKTNFTYCDGMKKEVIVITSKLEYYMRKIIKEHEESEDES